MSCCSFIKEVASGSESLAVTTLINCFNLTEKRGIKLFFFILCNLQSTFTCTVSYEKQRAKAFQALKAVERKEYFQFWKSSF